jgi:hypothetical protein
LGESLFCGRDITAVEVVSSESRVVIGPRVAVVFRAGEGSVDEKADIASCSGRELHGQEAVNPEQDPIGEIKDGEESGSFSQS